MALLQSYGYLNVKNEYFTLLGSFSSPNLLGAYLGVGITLFIWYLYVNVTKKKWLNITVFLTLLIVCVVVFLTKSRGTWLALICALSVLYFTSTKNFESIKKSPVSIKVFLIIGLFILIIFGSKYLYSLNKESVNGRVLIAKVTLEEITKKPAFGHGLFSFAGGYNKAKSEYFTSSERTWDEIQVGNYVSTAFNDYLLVAYECGLPFLLIALGLFIWILIKTKITSETRLGIALIVYLSIWVISNSISSSVSLTLMGLFGCSLILVYGNFKKSILKNKRMFKTTLLTIVLVFCSLGIFAVSSKVLGTKKFMNYYAQNKKSLDKDVLISFNKPMENNRNNNFQLGKLLIRSGYKEEGMSLMAKDFNRSSLPKIGRSLAQLYINNGNYKKAEEIYKFNGGAEPFRFEPKMDLIALMEKTNDYSQIVNLSKKIIEFPVKIPSIKVDEYKELSRKRIIKHSKYPNTTPPIHGTLSRFKTIKSKILNKKLLYKIYLPDISKIKNRLPVVYINDGSAYLNKGSIVKVLDSLIHNNIIEPICAVFLDPRDGYQKWKNVRQELFICNSEFVSFFTKEFMPLIERKHPVTVLKKGRTIMGISFGGLAAAYLARMSPNSFQNIVMQSPAFHPCKKIYSSYKNLPKENFNIYLSYGTGKDTEKQDLPMVEILQKKQYKLKVERVEGGNHSWGVWKEQLDDILIHFYTLE